LVYLNQHGGRVDVWNIKVSPPLLERRLSTGDSIRAIAFSPDSRLLAAGGVQPGDGGSFTLPALDDLLAWQRIWLWRMDVPWLTAPV